MNASIEKKLTELNERFEEVGHLLSDPDIIADNDRFRELSKEYSRLEPVTSDFRQYQQTRQATEEAQEMLGGDDLELADLAKEELTSLRQRQEELEQQLQLHLIPRDPNDDANLYLEIRAGTGGDEAAIFVGDLYRMYTRFAENQGWSVEILNSNEGEHGGFKEIITRIVGSGAYSKLKFESGAHRVQRVPETESQGRIHTSACTVAVLPELDDVEDIDVATSDLRVDTYRASGAGGQHVNKTDSAVRLTHLPTGIVVECQDERSQHKNRARAMGLLKARLKDQEEQRQAQEQAEQRRSLVGSGDRSERIRTYNFPQGRVTDHRINLTLYKLDEILQGNLDQVIEPLISEHHAAALTELAH